jgi:hypothetical protein
MMQGSVKCPKCGSESVLFSRKRSINVCEDCGVEFADAPYGREMRIFISYGHDEHASLARRICHDLRAHGHEVWFDEERLTAGADWESRIERGLEWAAEKKQSAAVVLLLTPHSVRRPTGYCLNEITRAVERGMEIVPLMVVQCEPPLSICRLQWLDMRECIPIGDKEAFYAPKFERLRKALENAERDFEGSQQFLMRHLAPLEFDADVLQHLRGFVGRQWVFNAISTWLEDPGHSRVFWLLGAPGVGKTAISAKLSAEYREIAGIHLCKYGHSQKGNPRRVVTSLAYQLATQLPAYQEVLAVMDLARVVSDDAATIFDNLLVHPLNRITQPDRRVTLLIDALDEASEGGRNDLARLLASQFDKTPAWLSLIITSRPDASVMLPLQALKPYVLDTSTAENRTDIGEYIARELQDQLRERQNAAAVVDAIIAKSEGIFLYAERVCKDITSGYLSLDQIATFPRGLGGVYWQFFERQWPVPADYARLIRPALRVITAAREPLPLLELRDIFGWDTESTHAFGRSLGALFSLSNYQGLQAIAPFHQSLRDWLQAEDKAGQFYVDIREGHRVLAQHGWRTCKVDVASLSGYYVRHLPWHLANVGSLRILSELLRLPDYLERLRTDGDIATVMLHCRRLITADSPAGEEMEQIRACLQELPEEKLGRRLHEHYRRASVHRLPEGMRPWEMLADKYRHVCIQAAQSILNIVIESGFCILLRNAPGAVEVFEFTAPELEILAGREHERWCDERMRDGWRFGEKRDDAAKVHDLLVPWQRLPDTIKKYPRATCREWLHILAECGYRLGRRGNTDSPIMATGESTEMDREVLSTELIEAFALRDHSRYVEGSQNRLPATLRRWEQLEDQYIEANWRYAAEVIRSLRVVGLGIRVSGKPSIQVFSDGEVEVLAELEHESWCRERESNGWTFGKVTDSAKKIHNCLVPWSRLPEQFRKYDRHVALTFPELLAQAGYELYRQHGLGQQSPGTRQ